MRRDNLLIVADSERDPDMLYAVGQLTRDPLIYFQVNGKGQVIANDLEFDRIRRGGGGRAHRLNTFLNKLRRNGNKSPTLARVIGLFLRERRLKRIVVPANFPLGLARELRSLKIKLKVKEGAFFRERESKSGEEIKKISAALIMAEVGLAEAIQALRSAKIAKNGRLMLNNVPLTSEKLRGIIDIAVMQTGGQACHTIVAAGKQSYDPREPGSGFLRANQPIILGVSPRSKKTGYFGEITRTVVKGRATERVRKVYDAVKRGQDLLLAHMEPGRLGKAVHSAAVLFFEKEGYTSARRNGHQFGYGQESGHGVGLELRETPWIGFDSKDVLRVGQVVAVAPGLFFPNLGGIRLEDVVVVTRGETRNLTKCEKTLEI